MKIIVIASFAESLINFRSELLTALIDRKHKVSTCAPGQDLNVESELAKIGVDYIPINLERTGLNPIRDLKSFLQLKSIFDDKKPDIVLCYTSKPVIYGSMAARRAGVRHIFSIITGLGYAFSTKSLNGKGVSRAMCLLYKTGLSANEVVFFQNPDDKKLFAKLGIVCGSDKSILINGSGINLGRFREAVRVAAPPTFLLIARLIKTKGIIEYVQAAKALKKRYPQASFRLLGPFDSNPAAISESDLNEWHESGTVEYLGETRDVRPFIAQAGVYVLPSYREGTPRSVLEAMAMGRPIITTDVPGCRETVDDGENGFLVPAKDAGALAKAMEKFILQPNLIEEMGKRSRTLAEQKYDVNKVNGVILKSMGLSD